MLTYMTVWLEMIYQISRIESMVLQWYSQLANITYGDSQSGSLNSSRSCILLAIELKPYSETSGKKMKTVLTLRLKLNQRERHPRSKLLRKPL